jgi:8-oxo-dGTP pyrophosphatase MutT (NUDIX family)
MFSPEESFAYWIAGIRELFEEAGVLLAYDQKGKLLQSRGREEQERLLHYRELLQKNKMTICELAQKENLLFALDHLHYYAHWITPEARSERFDTYFFIARYPLGQEASHDQKETTAGAWLTPRKALDENLTTTLDAYADQVAATRRMMLTGIAKPNPRLLSLRPEVTIMSLIPITSPFRFSKGPPELPGLIDASVWIA